MGSNDVHLVSSGFWMCPGDATESVGSRAGYAKVRLLCLPIGEAGAGACAWVTPTRPPRPTRLIL